MDEKRLTHLRQLEAESIHIIREVAAEFANPVMLYSIGKDSSVMLHLARKAFFPARCRSRCCTSIPAGSSAKCTSSAIAQRKSTASSCWCIKPGRGGDGHQPVRARQRQAYRHHEDRGAEAGVEQVRFRRRLRRCAARRGEIARQRAHLFVPRSLPPLGSEKPAAGAVAQLQRPDQQRESIRVFPLSNWTELDIWQYIFPERSTLCRCTRRNRARWWSATAC